MNKKFDIQSAKEIIQKEKLRTITQLVLDIQEITQISSTITALNVNFESTRLEAFSPIIPKYEEQLENQLMGGIHLTENATNEQVAHELTHAVLWDKIAAIPQRKLSDSIGEAVCDLVAVTLTYKEKKQKVIAESAAYYNQIVSPQDILTYRENDDPYTIKHASNESLGHVIGRRFGYNLQQQLSDIPLHQIIPCILDDPPSEEELINPTLYIPKVLKYQGDIEEFTPTEITVISRKIRIV